MLSHSLIESLSRSCLNLCCFSQFFCYLLLLLSLQLASVFLSDPPKCNYTMQILQNSSPVAYNCLRLPKTRCALWPDFDSEIIFSLWKSLNLLKIHLSQWKSKQDYCASSKSLFFPIFESSENNGFLKKYQNQISYRKS